MEVQLHSLQREDLNGPGLQLEGLVDRSLPQDYLSDTTLCCAMGFRVSEHEET